MTDFPHVNFTCGKSVMVSHLTTYKQTVDNNCHGTIAKVPPLHRGCKIRHRSLQRTHLQSWALGNGIVFQDTSENGRLWIYSKSTLLHSCAKFQTSRQSEDIVPPTLTPS